MKFSETQKDNVETYLRKKLPHGSGINCEWGFSWLGNGKLKASNSFHCMNETGFYDGYADFTIVFPVYKALTAFALHFNGSQAQYKNRQYMLRDYLEDTIYYALEDDESIFSIANKDL